MLEARFGDDPRAKPWNLCQSFGNDGLESIGINTKIAVLQCSLIKQFFGNEYRE